MKGACVGVLSIIELRNARWNIEHNILSQRWLTKQFQLNGNHPVVSNQLHKCTLFRLISF